jgi:hypothetical protein
MEFKPMWRTHSCVPRRDFLDAGPGVGTSADAARTSACATALFLINAFLTARLFHLDYSVEMGSIEAAYVSLAHYIRGHFPDLSWFPLWYGGIPYPDSYPPLLHFLVAAAGALCRVSSGLAYHAVTAAIYCLAPAVLFWTAWRLGAARPAAFVCALGYSLVSPACWLVREVRADSGGWFGPRRLVTLVRYGEGPHLASLLFLPLAIGLLHVALKQRRPLHYVLAALAMAAVVLSNWIGAFALALAVAAYLLAFGGWLRAAAIGGYAYAIALPWASPSTIATIRANAPLVGGRFTPDLRLEAGFALGFLLLAGALAAPRLAARVRFGILFLYATAFLTLAGYWFHHSVLPQPERYHLEMDLAFWLAAALLMPRFSARVERSGGPGMPGPYMVLALLVCVPILLHQRSLARAMEKPLAIGSTAEYEISTWLGGHMPGRRVFAPGTTGFWMDAFSDTPMLVGGFDNGMRNTFLQDIIFQVYYGDNQQVMVDWLDAFGCDAVVGGSRESREVYHPFAHPEKFAGLQELWRDGPEAIYAVPRGTTSLAHAVRPADFPAARPPAYNTGPLAPYLRALHDAGRPPASFRWTSQHSAVIQADLRPEDLLSVQITWDQGWSARVAGAPRRTWADPLGQMAIAPDCSGPCTVELGYDGGSEGRAAAWISRLALAAGFFWILPWRKRSDSTRTK